MSETQEIVNKQPDPSHFSMMPHMADDDLDPAEYRLYGHYKRVCGDTGACWEKTETTATKCKMSTGQVSTKRKSLAEKGYIKITERKRNQTRIIEIVPLWDANRARYVPSDNEEPSSNNETGGESSSLSEHGSSNNETKNTSFKKTQQEKEAAAEEESAGVASTDAQKAAAAAAVQEISTLYEQNIGVITPLMHDEIVSAIGDYNHQWIKDAIREAVKSNGKSWNYIIKILERWKREGRNTPKKTPAPSSAPPPPQSEGSKVILIGENEEERAALRAQFKANWEKQRNASATTA